MTKAKKTKKAPERKTALDQLAAHLRTALRRETKNIIEIGKLLSDSREFLEHGEWQPWLTENFCMSQRTATRYVNAQYYAATRIVSGSKMDTVSILNLSPTVLYGLAEGRYGEQEEAMILIAARKWRVGNTHAREICEALNPDDDNNDADDQEGSKDGAEDAEIAAILDGPPQAVPPPPPPPPPDFALRDFDQAIGALKKLATKSSAEFDRTCHSSVDLEHVEAFIRNVRLFERRREPMTDVEAEQITVTSGSAGDLEVGFRK